MDILKNFEFLENYVSGHKKIENNKEEFEDLFSHSKLTLYFYKKFLKERNVEIRLNFFSDEENIKLNKFLERFIFLHDIGKLNKFSQRYYKSGIKRNDTEHSQISFILILIYYYDYLSLISKKSINKSKKTMEKVFSEVLLLFSFVSAFHHTNLGKYSEKIVFEGINFNINFKYIVNEIIENKKEIIEDIIERHNNIFDYQNYLNLKNFKTRNILEKKELETLFFYIKFFYSLLVLSDYYATFAYQNNKKIEEIKIRQIDENLLKKLEKNFHKIKYNQKFVNINKMKIKNVNECNNVNELRNNLLIQATLNLQSELKKKNYTKVFMLNVPTGGGKTNISLKLALEILKFDKKVSRINWVFPFINIIEQNTEVIKKHYFDNNQEDIKNNLSQIYYNTIDFDNINKYKDLDEFNKNKIELFEKKINLDFINNPINIISSVNFFNMLFKVKKNNRYKFANFVNSIIIIDEIQTIPTESLDVFYQILEILSKNFNMYFIIMSATLPDIKMLNEIKGNNVLVCNLIENYKKYFNHEVFKRNIIEFKNEEYNKSKLINLIEEIKQNKIYKKILVVLNTIKSSVEIFEELRNKKDDWSTFILNSFVTSDVKNKIVNYIKNSKDENILLISTQSVEAGVDLDFDIGIRDIAILDSIEQVSGRINRECNSLKKEFKKLIVINYNNEGEKIYKGDLRFELLNELNIKKVLENKDFNFYYEKYFEKIKKKQLGSVLINFYVYIQNLRFDLLSNLNIIKNNLTITLVFDKISSSLFKYFPEEWKTIYDILDLIKNKNRNFDNKPIFDFINAILSKNSVQITFYNDEDLNEFISFLFENNYINSLENTINIKSMFIVNSNFFENYYYSYTIKNQKFTYFNILSLKEDFKKYNKKEGEALFI